ncbi:hypothetical protein [Streptomyces sp. NPDC059761]|uniref:hypothetical protein n=1 Tax=Streptomyces sp. NPDC059761 TaxID=3346937 RepID=UPI00364FA30F
MSIYDRPVAPYAAQKAQGLKPRGICSACGRDVGLKADNTVHGHARPHHGRKSFADRNRKTHDTSCPGGGETTKNLTQEPILSEQTYFAGDLQKLVVEGYPQADRFEMVGFSDGFRGVTYTTGVRKFWWAANDGKIADGPLPTRGDASDALSAYLGKIPAALPSSEPAAQAKQIDIENLQYPLVDVKYVVQYQTRSEPGIWWDARPEETADLDKAIEFSGRLAAGFDKPRGNPRAFVTATRIAQTTSTTVIVQGGKGV